LSITTSTVRRRRRSSSYRSFLREAGCGGVDGEEFYGLVPAGLDARGVPNAVWLYEDGLRRGQPARFFVVYDYGDGTAVALDLDRPGPDGELPCVAAHAGNWTHSEPVAPDFGAFLLATVREVMSDPDAASA
jgi:antitoxin YobK